MEIRYSADVREQLASFDNNIRERILKKMRFYRTQEDPLSFAKHLSGYGVYRFRVGDYRVLCDVRSDSLYVLAIAKRDDAYRDL